MFVMKPIQYTMHKEFQGFLTNNLKDVTEGLFVLAKRRMLSITFHLNTQMGFHWILIGQLLNVSFLEKTSIFPGGPASKVRSEVTDAPPILSMVAWNIMLGKKSYTSPDRNDIWSYFLKTNFICFRHFLNAITANLGIGIRENFPFFNNATQWRMCNAHWKHTIEYDWNKFRSRIPSKIIFIWAIYLLIGR